INRKNKMTDQTPVALITGSARRIGAASARTLHARGFRVLVHYHRSANDAETLAAELNHQRAESAMTLQADLNHTHEVEHLATAALGVWQRVDALINNASSFYPTPIGSATEAQF